MRDDFLHPLIALFALSSVAHGELVWEKWDVFTNLDNDGVVVVTETLAARVDGGEAGLERRLPAGTDQEIVIRKLVRVDGVEEHEVKDWGFTYGDLTWRIRSDSDPSLWKNQLLTFRLEYEVRGAVAPAWDIPAGPASLLLKGTFPNFRQRWSETFAAWREPLGRYRLDHDVIFARFSSEGPRELNYTFKYDTAWKHPRPDSGLNVRVTKESDYRVTESRDYLKPGTPPAVVMWKPLVRVGSIPAFAVLALGLWLIFAIGEIRRRGLFQTRLDRAWFEKNIAALPPEMIARHRVDWSRVPGFPLLLARWRNRGVIEVREGPEVDEDGDAILRLRLIGDESRLQAYERAMLKQLFPKGREITPRELWEVYAEEGFNPEDALEDALDDQEVGQAVDTSAPPASWFWRIVRGLMPLLFVASATLILIEAFRSQYSDFLQSGIYMGAGFLVLGLLACPLAASRGGLVASLAMLLPIIAAVPGLIALHFRYNLPPRPEGSAGLALLAFWFVAGLMLVARAWGVDLTPRQKLAADGRRYVRRELRRQHPDLNDAWRQHLVALGCGPDLAGWRQRRATAASAIAPPVLPGTLPSLVNLQPFTGNPENLPEEDWAMDMEVLSAEDRKDLENEGDEESEEDEDQGDNEDEEKNPPAK